MQKLPDLVTSYNTNLSRPRPFPRLGRAPCWPYYPPLALSCSPPPTINLLHSFTT